MPKEIIKDNEKKMDVVVEMNEEIIERKVALPNESLVQEDPVKELKPEATNKTQNNKRKKIVIISIIACFFLIILIFVGISLFNKVNLNVYKGIQLSGVDLSNKTELEVIEYVKLKQNELKSKSIKIEQDNNNLIEITASDFDFIIDQDKTVENIMKYGRNSNIFKNNINIFFARFKSVNIDISYKYSEEKLFEIIKEVEATIINKTIDDSYVLDEKTYKLIITKGLAGNSIDEDVFKLEIINALKDAAINKINIKIIKTEPKKLDADVIYSKVVRESKDAYVDKTTKIPKFISHVVGIDFDKEELRKIIDNMSLNKTVEFQLNLTEPKIKLADITWDLYNYEVSTYKTYFSTGDPNRVSNLGVALNILNGKVLMPGEIFSYNALVGGATAEQGFKPASTFVGGTIVKEVGGGICQTVSTLYNTALLANLEIIQRKNHSLPVGYVPGSRDATVYYPSVDFKFKNTRNYPIKISTKFNAKGNLSISLLGTKEDVEAIVSISSRTLSYIDYGTQYINDSTLEKGKQIVFKEGSRGYVSEAYKTIKTGSETKTVFLSKDTYKPMAQIIKVGTKEAIIENPVITEPVIEETLETTP